MDQFAFLLRRAEGSKHLDETDLQVDQGHFLVRETEELAHISNLEARALYSFSLC